MKTELYRLGVVMGLTAWIACTGCSWSQKEIPAPTGFGLLDRNVENTKLPPIQQATHEQPQPTLTVDDEDEETSGQLLQKQFDWLRGRGENHKAAVRLLAEAEEIYNRATNARATGNGVAAVHQIEGLYLQAAELYDEAAARWPDSALNEDALFMAGESYFFAQRYPEADDRYERALKGYPKSRYLDRVQRRRFSIAHYWLQFNERDPQHFYEFNLTDETLPWRDRFNFALRILDQIRLDDPTGDVADDATLLAADSCLHIGRFQQADDLYTDLIKTFPSSEHQFRAHWMAVQTKLKLYRGPDYGDANLVAAGELLSQLQRQFGRQLKERREDVTRLQAEIHYRNAERQSTFGDFFYKRASYGAARLYYRTLVDEYADTPFVDQARQRLVAMQGKPARPHQRFQWLADIFDTKDDIEGLLAQPPSRKEQE